MIYTMTLNPALDYVMHPLTLDMGYTNRSSSEELHCGGNGINISTLLKEVGTPSIAMGIAAGFTGDYLLKRLQEKGISSNFVCLDNGFTRINVKLNGIVMTMCNGMGPKISEKKVYELLDRMDVIGAGDTLVLTGSIPNSLPSDMYDQIMKRFAGRGIQFVVDAPGQLLRDSLPAHPFLIKPNSEELSHLMGRALDSQQELTAAARELLQTGVQKVIVSMGSRGMLHVLPEQTIFVPGLRVPVKDTVGAGDAVIAALAVAEERGLTLEETLRLSTAAGAASVMCTGTQAASLETIQQLMEQVTYREL